MSYQELKQNLEGIPTIIGQASKGTLAWPRGVRSGSKLSKDGFRTSLEKWIESRQTKNYIMRELELEI